MMLSTSHTRVKGTGGGGFGSVLDPNLRGVRSLRRRRCEGVGSCRPHIWETPHTPLSPLLGPFMYHSLRGCILGSTPSKILILSNKSSSPQ